MKQLSTELKKQLETIPNDHTMIYETSDGLQMKLRSKIMFYSSFARNCIVDNVVDSDNNDVIYVLKMTQPTLKRLYDFSVFHLEEVDDSIRIVSVPVKIDRKHCDIDKIVPSPYLLYFPTNEEDAKTLFLAARFLDIQPIEDILGIPCAIDLIKSHYDHPVEYMNSFFPKQSIVLNTN